MTRQDAAAAADRLSSTSWASAVTSRAGLERSILGTHRPAQREEGRREILRTRDESAEQGVRGRGTVEPARALSY